MATCFYTWKQIKQFVRPLNNQKNFHKFEGIANKMYLEAYFSTLFLCKIGD